RSPVAGCRFLWLPPIRPSALPLCGYTAPMPPRAAELLSAARAAWPGVSFSEKELADFVLRRLGPKGLEPELRERAVELALTCAWAGGDAAAIALFERTFFDEVDWAARRSRASDAVAKDARQNLARYLFLGDSPAVATFRARGELRGWFRVAATREVLRLITHRKREVLIDDERFLEDICPPTDPDIGHLREKLRGPLREAFARAIATLSDQHRELLR